METPLAVKARRKEYTHSSENDAALGLRTVESTKLVTIITDVTRRGTENTLLFLAGLHSTGGTRTHIR